MDKLAIAIVITVATGCVIAASAQKASENVGTPNAEAMAYHVMAGAYRRAAVYCGEHALALEAAYWKVINA